MQLSVIVPMYNVEKYIEECLMSLVKQTFKDMEILVVNDGSTDTGPRVVERMALRYPNIKLIHKTNGGLSDARNYGLSYALGDYVTFLDSDDYVSERYYEKMMDKIQENFDVVVCDVEYVYEDATPSWILPGLSPWTIEDIQKRALLSPMYAWNKVYHRSFFKENGIRYPLNSWYEDIPVSTEIFSKTAKIGYVAEALVHYRQRRGSIMAEVNSPRQKDIFSIMAMVREKFTEEELYEKYYQELEYLHIEHLCLYGMFRFMRSDQFDFLYEEAMKVMKIHFPKWKKNPYIAQLGKKNRYFLKGLHPWTRNGLRFIVQD
ncbi:MAG: glycosyltransferase [Anaerorhabdus sp.]